MATHTLTALDTFTVRHLSAWLERVSLDPDAAFDRVTTWLAAQPDTGYWPNLGWPAVADAVQRDTGFDVYAGEMR